MKLIMFFIRWYKGMKIIYVSPNDFYFHNSISRLIHSMFRSATSHFLPRNTFTGILNVLSVANQWKILAYCCKNYTFITEGGRGLFGRVFITEGGRGLLGVLWERVKTQFITIRLRVKRIELKFLKGLSNTWVMHYLQTTCGVYLGVSWERVKTQIFIRLE